MKNLSKFEVFKLDKDQMNAIAGGVVRCLVKDYDGVLYKVDKVAPGISASQAERILESTYLWADSVSCRNE